MTAPDPVSEQDLMRYLDGELPPAERARVEAALDASPQLRGELDTFRSLRAGFHDLTFPPAGPERSVWDRVAARVFRSSARMFIGIGVALWLGYAAYELSMGRIDAWTRVTVGGLAIGVLVLFALVIRDRYRPWSDDG
jgi:anti-sigma factor RsiW